jgi:hypothetical protein
VLEDPDTFFKTMLEVENPLCPKKLKGVWWMRDNIANERFATFQDGNWVNPRLGFKTMNTNWSRNATYFGAGLTFAFGTTLADFMNIELSPTENWIRINGGNWMYYMNEGEEPMKYPEDWWEPELRGKAAVVPGDICRLSYDVPSDKRAFNVPVDKMKGDKAYQYVVKRVCYMENGKLVYTPAFEEFKERASRPFNATSPKPACCGSCMFNLNKEQLARVYQYEGPEQVVVYASKHPDLRGYGAKYAGLADQQADCAATQYLGGAPGFPGIASKLKKQTMVR